MYEKRFYPKWSEISLSCMKRVGVFFTQNCQSRELSVAKLSITLSLKYANAVQASEHKHS